MEICGYVFKYLQENTIYSFTAFCPARDSRHPILDIICLFIVLGSVCCGCYSFCATWSQICDSVAERVAMRNILESVCAAESIKPTTLSVGRVAESRYLLSNSSAETYFICSLHHFDFSLNYSFSQVSNTLYFCSRTNGEHHHSVSIALLHLIESFLELKHIAHRPQPDSISSS
jgi:hypothetical protein